jgi:hypothetical protein
MDATIAKAIFSMFTGPNCITNNTWEYHQAIAEVRHRTLHPYPEQAIMDTAKELGIILRKRRNGPVFWLAR